jgi:hypothetical protein
VYQYYFKAVERMITKSSIHRAVASKCALYPQLFTLMKGKGHIIKIYEQSKILLSIEIQKYINNVKFLYLKHKTCQKTMLSIKCVSIYAKRHP